MTPGANLLSVAAQLITMQSLGHLAYASRTVNEAGDFVTVYAAPVAIVGSLQPVQKNLYQELGLNFSKSYFTLHTSADVRPLARDREGDRVTYAGRTYLCESDLDWRGGDGWRKLLMGEVFA